MLAVLWSLGARADGDRRRFPRVLSGRGEAQVSDASDGQRRRVSVWDLSADGTALLYPVELPQGRELVVELPRPVRCRVTYCRRHGELFRVGAGFVEFLDQPPALPGRMQEMNASTQSETSSPASIQQWFSAGESLYSALLKEFQSVQTKLAELEAYLQQKAAEVNQIGQMLGKPAVQNTRLSAELVTHYPGELRTSDEALRIRPPAAKPAAPRPVRPLGQEPAGAAR